LNILKLIYVVSAASAAVVLAFVLVQSALVSREFWRALLSNKPHKY
jgi:hypothetical protein